ncbi:MAG: phosphate/phosphite/phosphonate ABC transporter substrate-binding protein [Halothiobacillus sp.]|jgi:phosphonate transport system substrate-binding protein|nr:phosphate/phosphite/phosphonate ABC transporter substrate-binding protein [Halothiobacillus sp.]
MVLTFGVAPQQSPSTLVRIWGPILSEVGREAGVKLVFKTAPDIPTFEERLAKGEYDIAYMNPYHYIELHKKPGYLALLRARDRQLRGILVTRRDAPYHSIADLSGQTLAFPGPAAFAASIVIRAEFARLHVPITPAYVSSHDSVYLGVAKGLFPAGGGIMRTFNALSPTIRDQLHVIYVSQGYTPHAIAILPDMPTETAARIQAAFIGLDKSAQGRQLLVPMEIKGWMAAQDADWDDVRALCGMLSIKSFEH